MKKVIKKGNLKEEEDLALEVEKIATRMIKVIEAYVCKRLSTVAVPNRSKEIKK